MQAAHPNSSSEQPKLAPWIPRPRRYLAALFAMLMSATIFEGYDITIFHLATPEIARTFHMADPAIGLMATIVRFGGMLSFFVVILADRYGRKPIISTTVVCYTLFTLFTALSTGVKSFTIFQSTAQIFLAAEFGVAVTMISEEFPDATRGRAIAALHMVAFLGVTAAALSYAIMAESRWGWRGMYLLGIAPLVMVAFLRRRLRETARFSALERARAAASLPRPGFWTSIRNSLAPFAGPYRSRLLVMAGLWNSIGLIGGPTVTYFSLYARRDHHWKSHQVAAAIILAYAMGTVGSLLSGFLMDRLGRKFTTSFFYLMSGAAMYVLFTSDRYGAILAGEVVTMFAYQAARTATSALSTELFPTSIRATGYSLCVQVIGQICWMLSPVVIGLLSGPLGGLGNAASFFAAGPLLGVAIVLWFVPETRGKTLEELSPSAAETPPAKSAPIAPA
ncbi:MFS transporter [Candidatus Binatus sp.]|jgi:putative MFS transporter|uniref:MFS transporter n=1 Tax=Candidatus Binatus sp. TaxID=2811406 RepID=UPI003C53B649